MQIPTRRERAIFKELRYLYLRQREIDRAVQALERLQRLRETGIMGGKPSHPKAGRAA